MSVINKAYEAYDLMMNGYLSGNPEKSFEHESNILFRNGVVRQAATRDMPAWSENDEASILLSTIRNCYYRWQNNTVDRRVNRVRMYQAAQQLAAMLLDNPFSCDSNVVLNDSCTMSQDQLKKVAMGLESGTEANEELTTHIMGVLPANLGDE